VKINLSTAVSKIYHLTLHADKDNAKLTFRNSLLVIDEISNIAEKSNFKLKIVILGYGHPLKSVR